MSARAELIVGTVLGLDTMADLPRTGWLLRGVRPCESIADHSYFVALVTMLLVDALRAEGAAVDGEKALRMALEELERGLAEELLPPGPREVWEQMEEGASLEARIVKAADKIQMMIKALAYGRAHRGHLEEFWQNPKNFDDRGLPLAREVFEAIAARAGRGVPR
jgi:putative hydrolase of HD superfamily